MNKTKSSEKESKQSMDLNGIQSEELKDMLQSLPAVKSQFLMIVVALRRRQLHGAHPCAKATMEILRAVVKSRPFSQ